MRKDDLKNLVSSCLNDIVFDYNGMSCGITSEVHNYIPVFQAWYGDNIREYNTVEDIINDKFYNGHSLIDLLCEKNIQYSVI